MTDLKIEPVETTQEETNIFQPIIDLFEQIMALYNSFPFIRDITGAWRTMDKHSIKKAISFAAAQALRYTAGTIQNQAVAELLYGISYDGPRQVLKEKLTFLGNAIKIGLNNIGNAIVSIDDMVTNWLINKGIQISKTLGRLGCMIGQIPNHAGALVGKICGHLGTFIMDAWKALKHWLAGTIILGFVWWWNIKFMFTSMLNGIGTVFKGILHFFTKKVMTFLLGAFTAKSVTVALALMKTVFLAAAGLLSLILVESLINNYRNAQPPRPFAKGGFPISEQPFIARESGPELVGKIGSRNAVVNDVQIEKSVAQGVYDAFRSYFANGSLNTSAIAEVYFDGKLMASAAPN